MPYQPESEDTTTDADRAKWDKQFGVAQKLVEDKMGDILQAALNNGVDPNKVQLAKYIASAFAVEAGYADSTEYLLSKLGKEDLLANGPQNYSGFEIKNDPDFHELLFQLTKKGHEMTNAPEIDHPRVMREVNYMAETVDKIINPTKDS